MLFPWLPGASLHPPLNLGLLGLSVTVGAVLKPFSTAPSRAARRWPGAFPILLFSVRLMPSALPCCWLCCPGGWGTADSSPWGAELSHAALGSLCIVKHEGWLLCHPASTHSSLETWIFAIEGAECHLLVRCSLSPAQACGTAVSQPLLGPVAAPEGRGMSSAAGNVLCWCRGRAHRALCGVVLALMPWAVSCCGRPGARCAAARCGAGAAGGARGFQHWGKPLWCLLCPGRRCSAVPVLEVSRGFGVSVALALCPRQAGEGLAGRGQSSTHGSLLLYKGRTFRRLPFFPPPQKDVR